jgi:hypothetical protein
MKRTERSRLKGQWLYYVPKEGQWETATKMAGAQNRPLESIIGKEEENENNDDDDNDDVDSTTMMAMMTTS